MRKKAKDKMKNSILQASVIVSTAFTVLLWHDVLASAVPLITVRQNTAPSVLAAADFDGAAANGTPVRIKIPRMGVNAAVVKVGLAKDGSMDVPKRPKDAAWYMLGPKPGEVGSAVIAGHVDWLYGAKGSFERLKNLKPGDKIAVQDDKGATVTFVVREARNYDAAADATAVFVSKDGKAHLNLITCGGKWDKRARTYSKRLVVFADKVTE
jgi:LPXTG-site transpeptidase (sortase) family protein